MGLIDEKIRKVRHDQSPNNSFTNVIKISRTLWFFRKRISHY